MNSIGPPINCRLSEPVSIRPVQGLIIRRPTAAAHYAKTYVDRSGRDLRHCSALRNEALAAGEAVAQRQSEPRGTLRIACRVTLAQTTVGERIPRCLALNSLATPDLRETNRAVNLVEEGRDIALRVRGDLSGSNTLWVKQLNPTSSFSLASPE